MAARGAPLPPPPAARRRRPPPPGREARGESGSGASGSGRADPIRAEPSHTARSAVRRIPPACSPTHRRPPAAAVRRPPAAAAVRRPPAAAAAAAARRPETVGTAAEESSWGCANRATGQLYEPEIGASGCSTSATSPDGLMLHGRTGTTQEGAVFKLNVFVFDVFGFLVCYILG